MIDLKLLYTQRASMFALGEQMLRKKRNIITTAKVISFCLLIYSLWKFTTAEPDIRFYFLIGFLLLLSIYVWLSVYDSGIWKRIQQASALVKCNRIEADYLQGDYSQLPSGAAFTDPAHNYSNDLDIFGENSVFQEINRTVTHNGCVKLAEMFNPKNTIPDNTHTVAALSPQTNNMNQLPGKKDFLG